MEIEDLASCVQALEFTNKEECQAHQQQVLRLNEGHEQAIEEKDAMLALLNDNLKNYEHDNVVLQAQRNIYDDQLQKFQDIISHLRTRYVPHAKDPGKDDIVMIIEKNTIPEKDESYEYPVSLLHCKNTTTVRWHKKYDGLRHNIPIINL